MCSEWMRQNAVCISDTHVAASLAPDGSRSKGFRKDKDTVVRQSVRRLWWFAAGALGLIACGRPASSQSSAPPRPEWFADITDRVGLKFVAQAGPIGSYFMP